MDDLYGVCETPVLATCILTQYRHRGADVSSASAPINLREAKLEGFALSKPEQAFALHARVCHDILESGATVPLWIQTRNCTFVNAERMRSCGPTTAARMAARRYDWWCL